MSSGARAGIIARCRRIVRNATSGRAGSGIGPKSVAAKPFDISKLFAKWMQDISDPQRPSGSLPDVAPAFWPIYSDNVTAQHLIIAPNVLHRQYGDTAPIAASYGGAKKWLEYMSRFMTNGIIAGDSYGDWCVPPEDPKLIHSKDPVRQTDKHCWPPRISTTTSN